MAERSPFEQYPIVSESAEAPRPAPFAQHPALEAPAVPGSKAEQVGRSFAQSAARSSGMMSGLLFGLRAGAPLAATGPWGAAGAAALGALGAAGGYLLPEAVLGRFPKAQTPSEVFGEFLGAGAALTPLPLIASKVGFAFDSSSAVGRLLNRIIDQARSSPGRFFSSEASRLMGGGIGGALAQEQWPGQEGRRFFFEVAGGLLHPLGIVSASYGSARDAVTRAVSMFHPSASESLAASFLKAIAREAGEDPAEIVRRARAAGIPGVELTLGQKTGSRAMIETERALIKMSASFGRQHEERTQNALRAMTAMIEALGRSSDAAAQTAAKEIQGNYLKMLMDSKIEQAKQAAVEAAARISSDSPAERAQLSRRALELLENALSSARQMERELWSKIPRSVQVSANSLMRKHRELAAEMLPTESVASGALEEFVQQLQKKEYTTAGELLVFRSRALAAARSAEASHKPDEARRLGELAAAALEDLSRLEVPGVSQAREFSRALNDAFSRTFAGEALGTRPSGAHAIPPELMLRRALAGGSDVGALRLSQIEAAMRFLPDWKIGGDAAKAHLQGMMEIQERIFRLAAREVVDPQTGQASAARVSRFLQDNAALLRKFPEVERHLRGALSATRSYEQALERFGKLARFESGADAVRAALRAAAPEQALVHLARIAQSEKEGALALRASVIEALTRSAQRPDGTLDAVELQRSLFEPLRPGLSSVAQILLRERVWSDRDLSRARQLVEEMARLQTLLSYTRTMDLETLERSSELMRFLTRSVGAAVGSIFGRMLPGPLGARVLVQAGAGSQLLQYIVQKMPVLATREVIARALLDPQLGALLLERAETVEQARRIGLQLHAYLGAAALTSGLPSLVQP